jgi:hypothetical protein
MLGGNCVAHCSSFVWRTGMAPGVWFVPTSPGDHRTARLRRGCGPVTAAVAPGNSCRGTR